MVVFRFSCTRIGVKNEFAFEEPATSRFQSTGALNRLFATGQLLLPIDGVSTSAALYLDWLREGRVAVSAFHFALWLGFLQHADHQKVWFRRGLSGLLRRVLRPSSLPRPLGRERPKGRSGGNIRRTILLSSALGRFAPVVVRYGRLHPSSSVRTSHLGNVR